MKKVRFFVFTFFALVLLLVLYAIWSLPFELFARKVLLPTTEVIGNSVDKAIYPIRLAANISRLDEKNRDLQRQNDELQSEIVRIKEESKFCQQVGLENQLYEGRKSVVARIIGRTPQNFNQVLVVDRGEGDGIKEKAAVLSNGYLIGQVSSVDKKSSKVILITNHNNITPAMLDKSREFGLLQGSLGGLVLSDIPSATKVEDREKVLSSGLGGEIPKGLLIGEVSHSEKVKGLFQTLRVESPFVLSKAEVITILIDE